MLNLTTKELLGLSVLAAVITTIGSLLATVLKDFVFARWLETWKGERSAQAAWDKYRIPMCVSAIELMRRIEDVYREFPCDYLAESVLREKKMYFQINDRSDPHYRHYKLVSTLYRFCSFLGWVELYRREVMTLPESAAGQRAKLEERLAAIRISLADGQIQTADDWETWTDRLIFREELRALGELMINSDDTGPLIIGYSRFCVMLNESAFEGWAGVLLNFFLLNGDGEKDFRKERFRRLIIDLCRLAHFLDKDRVPADCKDWDEKYASPSTVAPVTRETVI